MNKYFKQYKWSNIFTMLHNQKLKPKICNDPFKNRLVVITGATSGIGLEAAKKYAAQGAAILTINRSETKSKALCQMLKNDYGIKCSYFIADFSCLTDIHKVAKKLATLDQKIDVLIHNAGVYLTKKKITADNLEEIFEINYLSSFIINYYLKDKFIMQNSGRIIFVNSEAHRFAAWGLHLNDLKWEKRKYSGLKSYGAAKLAQLLSIIKFNEYFAGTGVTINAMHPGNVKTNSGQENGKLYKIYKKIIIDRRAKSMTNAVEALYYLGVSKNLKKESGQFFNLTTKEEPAPPALDHEVAEAPWQLSIELGGLK